VKRPWLWIFAGIFLARAFAATGYAGWRHPDEWFQTLEFAQLFLTGTATYSQEFGLHLRNTFLPLVLAAPLGLARLIDPGDVALRIWSVQIFMALLSLLGIWGFRETLRALKKDLPLATEAGATLTFALLFFQLRESFVTSNENASQIFWWWSMGLCARGRWFWGFFVALAVPAIRYPSGLLCVGPLLLLLPHLKTQWKPALQGIGAGLVAFGLPDALFYGRPWESAYQYLLYNVFTGLSHQVFGSQTLSTYFEQFTRAWILPEEGIQSALYPVWAALFGVALIRTTIGLAKREAWAWTALVYFAGHALSSHKEPRFMIPLQGLLLFGALLAAIEWTPRLKPRTLQAARILGLALLLISSASTAWGERWKYNGSYLQVTPHLRTHPQTCAVLTLRYPNSILFPEELRGAHPSPAFGRMEFRTWNQSIEQSFRQSLVWQEIAPQCSERSNILIHRLYPDIRAGEFGCEALSAPWRAGTPLGFWYRCPARMLTFFQIQRVTKLVGHSLGRWERLLPPSTRGEVLMQEARRVSPPPSGFGTPDFQ
jgi:hypothetical protein